MKACHMFTIKTECLIVVNQELVFVQYFIVLRRTIASTKV
jgi:hypothetical protein